KKDLRQIALIAMRLGVEGNRADLFALKAARANAALAGRNVISEDDVVTATQLVLVPRSTTLPAPPEESDQRDERDEQLQQAESDAGPHVYNREGEGNSITGPLEDLIIQAIDSRVPAEVFRSGRARRSFTAGKRFRSSQADRGKYVRSAPGKTGTARVAIDATLRVAAPFQVARRQRSSGHRCSNRSSWLRAGATQVRIEKADLRFKRFKHRSGILFIFAVDASGSMAVNRMAQAKGAIIRLLNDAYLHRDQVALL